MLEKMIEPELKSGVNGTFYKELDNTKSNELVLLYNNVSNLKDYLIPFERGVRNGKASVLEYFPDEMMPLSEFVKKNALKAIDVKNIVLSIDKLLKELENASISENSINLEVDGKMGVFIDKNNTLRFAIVPDSKRDFRYELSKFLIRVLRYTDTKDRDALTLAYSLFVRSSKDIYSINELKEMANDFYIKDQNSSISIYKDINKNNIKSASDIQKEYSSTKTGIIYDKDGFLPKISHMPNEALNAYNDLIDLLKNSKFDNKTISIWNNKNLWKLDFTKEFKETKAILKYKSIDVLMFQNDGSAINMLEKPSIDGINLMFVYGIVYDKLPKLKLNDNYYKSYDLYKKNNTKKGKSLDV